MRTNNLITASVVAAMAMGCGYQATTVAGKRGATMKQQAGAVSLVFTNASPEKMCNLQLSFDGDSAHGDNWLPAEGLESGKSVQFKVKPGKYKAIWNTCTSTSKPYYAATLCGEWAFDVKDSTQLFAYVADTVAPTKRAAPKDFHAMVKFPGQQINPGQAVARNHAMPKTEQPEQTAEHRDPNAKGTPAATNDSAFDAKDFVDTDAKKAKKGDKKADKKAVKPSLDRKVDVSNSKVKYASRN